MRTLFAILLLTAGATMTTPATPQAPTPAAARAALAPSGTLRAAINFGNPVLATRDTATGEPRGVSVDFARELAKRLDVPLQFVTYAAAGTVVAGIRSGEWDIAYFAVDPARAADVDFTAPYVVIEGAYLVRQQSPLRQVSDVDRDGVRVVAARGSAYDLYLSRELKKAHIAHAPTSQAVTDMMIAQNLEVAAGVRQQLQADAQRLPGLRLLDGRFMVIEQAMALPKGRPVGARYLAGFVEAMKATGFIAASLKRHGIEGAQVAPAGPLAAVSRGQEIFQKGAKSSPSCLTCHQVSAGGVGVEIGPNLAGIGERAATRRKGMAGRQYLEQSILRPKDYVVPGYRDMMYPNYGKHLTPQDIADLIAYLMTL